MHDPDLWKAILTALGAAAILVISEPFKWAFKSWVEHRAVRKDVEKWPLHLVKNEKWIDLMIAAIELGKVPHTLHLEKMKIPQDTVLFSPDYSKHLLPTLADNLHETRLLARNVNIDIDAAIAAVQAGSDNAIDLLHYLKARMIFLAHAMPYAIDGKDIPPCNLAARPTLQLATVQGTPDTPTT